MVQQNCIKHMMSSILADNQSESRDCESQEGNTNASNNHEPQIASTSTSKGYYDAEKCRAYMASQNRVSKIDRFASQVIKAVEVEADVNERLSNLLTMFVRRSASVARDFTLKCKLGFQRHRQDRILNHPRKTNLKRKANTLFSDSRRYSISNDLLYGQGAQLVQTLLSQSVTPTPHKHIKRKPESSDVVDGHNNIDFSMSTNGDLTGDDCLQADLFDPSIFVKKLEDCFRNNLFKSKSITCRLNTVRQIFERLASEHRDKVDFVYAAEEERQATTVVRRSAYNLSIAAIKATSTPVHVNHE